jgi:hypothetical protein
LALRGFGFPWMGAGLRADSLACRTPGSGLLERTQYISKVLGDKRRKLNASGTESRVFSECGHRVSAAMQTYAALHYRIADRHRQAEPEISGPLDPDGLPFLGGRESAVP